MGLMELFMKVCECLEFRSILFLRNINLCNVLLLDSWCGGEIVYVVLCDDG